MQNHKLPISEIFYSLQGEGIRTGHASVFIRIQGCKAKGACYASGVLCDTEFESGQDMTLEQLHTWMCTHAPECRTIVWTGGEPADRITDEVAEWFNQLGYWQCIETSGLFSVSHYIDHITISPKVAEHVIQKNFDGIRVHELKYVRHRGQSIPQPSIEADSYFIQPHSNANQIDAENLKHCIQLCLDNPKWSLSVQNHKIWNVL